MKPYLLTVILLILNGSSIYSQKGTLENIIIKGQVVDSLTKETVPFATIKIMEKGKPTILLKAVAADDNGKFRLAVPQKGSYIVIAEFIGKETVTKHLDIDEIKTIDIGTIMMKDNSKELSEFVISAQKPLVKVDLDKITYSIEDDPESKTNNVLDMLKKVPLVTVDGEEKIQLKGSSNFKIYLNGKPSNMISNNPKDVLRGMPANTVKDIQVITDPGAKYDAEGVSGIINIITQKNTSMGGITGTINGRVDDKGAFGGGTYLSLKYGKIGFTGSYNYYEWKQPKGIYSSFREDLGSTQESMDNRYLYQNGVSKNNGNGQYGSGELSFEIDTLNLINVGFNRYLGSSKSESDWLVELMDINDISKYNYNQLGNTKNTYGGTDLNVDYQRSFKKKDQLLTASYRFSFSPSDSKSSTDIQNPVGILPPEAIINKQFTDADMKEHTFQVDFVTPFNKIHSLETGAKYIIRINESNSGIDILNLLGEWQNNPQNTDKFKHEQDILAAYGGYSAKFKKWGIKTGLRYEATWLKAEFPLMEDKGFKVDYSNLIPSATVTYQIKPAQNIRLGYNMRISRPGIWQLNPYNNTSNPNYIQIGNPELDAVKTHSISSNYGYFSQKININLNMSYNFQDNSIENITTLENGISTTTYQNIGNRKSTGLSGYISWSPNDKLRLYSNMSGQYIDIKTNNEKKLSNNGFGGSIFAGGQYTTFWKIRTNVNSGFFSSQISLESKSPSFFFYGLSVSREFELKNKFAKTVTVRLYGDNPFTKNKEFKSKTQNEAFFYESNSSQRMRTFGFALSFRFGELKSQIKKTQRGISNDDTMQGGGQGQTGQSGGQGQ
ncbi:outer membrane beta-barrel family protein [Dysgonomonas sp. BGC7]|uniref:outer membrane beta-barrel family protein n=1 Tax=Dysgonomonas sp. BGC7 TaxID=1658008 RepID=UPI0006821F7E|nr:outer membrane beta-barrel family protein [Dysgonomonas sp. BGC7]MBD8390093.1 TonB-dependent receptor [Dysgonomonas sp. BGC7]